MKNTKKYPKAACNKRKKWTRVKDKFANLLLGALAYTFFLYFIIVSLLKLVRMYMTNASLVHLSCSCDAVFWFLNQKNVFTITFPISSTHNIMLL